MGKLSNQAKVIRYVIGIAAIAAGIYFKSWWGLLGLIPVLGAVTGFCPLCKSGDSCCKKNEKGETPKPDQGKTGGCCGHSH